MAKTRKNTVSFLKNVVVNRYANHALSVFNATALYSYYVLLQNFPLQTIYEIQIHSVYNYAALQNNPKTRNYSDSEVFQHGKRNSL